MPRRRDVPRRFAEATKVPAIQSRAEIERLLSRHQCTQYGTAVDTISLTGRVQFRSHDRIVRFTFALPDPQKYRVHERHEQETRRIWRALLLVIKAKLEVVENKIATFEEEFLAHIVMPNEQTVGDLVGPLILDAYAHGRMPRALLGAGTAATDPTKG